jgi:hypothetical protein
MAADRSCIKDRRNVWRSMTATRRLRCVLSRAKRQSHDNCSIAASCGLTNDMLSIRQLAHGALMAWLVAIAASVLPAAAQDVYRCQENGRTVFSDKPCRDGRAAAAAVPAPAAVPPPAAAAAPARAAATAPAAPGLGYATREQSCADGSQKACDELACIRNDMDACKRIGGLRGSFWFEESRRRETLRATSADGKPTLRRVTLHKIRCTGARKDRSAEVTPQGDGYVLGTGRTVYPSIDAAAAALCRG